MYGKATNMVWESMNKGKLVDHVDWSKFKVEDDDEEEEEEEEDDDDDE